MNRYPPKFFILKICRVFLLPIKFLLSIFNEICLYIVFSQIYTYFFFKKQEKGQRLHRGKRQISPAHPGRYRNALHRKGSLSHNLKIKYHLMIAAVGSVNHHFLYLSATWGIKCNGYYVCSDFCWRFTCQYSSICYDTLVFSRIRK